MVIPSSDGRAEQPRRFGIFGALLSLIFWLWLLGLGIFFALVIFASWPFAKLFDRRLAFLHWYCVTWANITLSPFRALGLLKLSVKGKEHLPTGPAVIVANHLSQLDILVSFTTWAEFKWVSKASLFKIPFIGWGMAASGYIALKRGDSASVKQMMKDCRAALDRGSRVVLFPEGTRSKTGKLQAFKPGPFVIASKGKVPVVPLVIRGTAQALPKHGWRFAWGSHMELEFLEPFSAEQVNKLGSKGVMKECHARFEAAL